MFTFSALGFGAVLACLLMIPLIRLYVVCEMKVWEMKQRIDQGDVFQRMNVMMIRGVWPRVERATVPLGFGRETFGIPRARLITGEEGRAGIAVV